MALKKCNPTCIRPAHLWVSGKGITFQCPGKKWIYK